MSCIINKGESFELQMMIGLGVEELSFEKLMVNNNNSGGGCKMGGGGVIREWKDIPMELLLRIVALVDDRTVIVASGVCSGWRDAISWGLTHLSLSWYMASSLIIPFFEQKFKFLLLDCVFCFWNSGTFYLM